MSANAEKSGERLPLTMSRIRRGGGGHVEVAIVGGALWKESGACRLPFAITHVITQQDLHQDHPFVTQLTLIFSQDLDSFKALTRLS